MIVLLCIAVFLVSALATRFVVAHAQKIASIDIPNDRSSHLSPTPRGGGIVFVATSILGFIIVIFTNQHSQADLVALCVAGALVAGVGYLDDQQKISGATLRLAVHSISAIILIIVIGLPQRLYIVGTTINPGVTVSIIAVLYIVWLLNLFNFMDGIDGIASSEAVFTCLAGALLSYRATSEVSYSEPALVLAAGVLGFLIFNWSPAKIFMGDIGSGFLGVVIAGLSLASAAQHPDLLWIWLILLGSFISDSTVTLIRRLLRKHKPHIAHRSHAYQHLAIRYQSHAKISLTYLAVNIFWLLPIAFAVESSRISGTTGLLIAYLPLTIAAVFLGAGKDVAKR